MFGVLDECIWGIMREVWGCDWILMRVWEVSVRVGDKGVVLRMGG